MDLYDIILHIYAYMARLRLLTHVGFFRQNGLILSEDFVYIERSKNLEKKYVINVQKIHLPKGI